MSPVYLFEPNLLRPIMPPCVRKIASNAYTLQTRASSIGSVPLLPLTFPSCHRSSHAGTPLYGHISPPGMYGHMAIAGRAASLLLNHRALIARTHATFTRHTAGATTATPLGQSWQCQRAEGAGCLIRRGAWCGPSAIRPWMDALGTVVHLRYG